MSTDYFGTQVRDNYRYLENLQAPEVLAWTRAQASYTSARLAAIPGRERLRKRIHALRATDLLRTDFKRIGDRFFYRSLEPGAPAAKLYYRDGLDGAEHLLVDPGALGKASGRTVSLDYFQPSWDGKYLAYGTSYGGSEASVLQVIEVDTGATQAEAVGRTGHANVAWRPDNRSFFYMRFPEPTPQMSASDRAYNARTHLHVVGRNPGGEGDALVFGRGVAKDVDVPAVQGTYIVVAEGSPQALAVANQNLDQNPATIFVAPLEKIEGPETPWRKLADVADGVTQFQLLGDRLYFLSQKNAPNFRLLSTPLAAPDISGADVVVPESDSILSGFSVAKDGLYVRERRGALSQVRRVPLDGSASRVVALPFEGTVTAPITDPNRLGAVIGIRSWLQRTRFFSYDPLTNASRDADLVPPQSVDTSPYESKEVDAVSYDGTRVPLSLIYRRGIQLDGSHPTLLSGYGSYGVSIEPGFSASSLAWLERDGVVAYAHVRGGGERGAAWHEGGRLSNKSNTIMDFIACAQYLIDARYTVPARLAGEGSSAGGIAVGGAFTWRPDLFGVVLDHAGNSDTLRHETEPNGPPNVPEFGSIRTEAGFRALYAMSAYHHVRDGVAYPAAMFSTGANDPRVAPWHMTKMAARIQAATTSGRPVLLRVDFDAGHGPGASAAQVESLLADRWSFALWQIGLPEFQP